MRPRFFFPDFLRGIAVIAMIAFHLTFDLVQFGSHFFNPPLAMPPWFWTIVPSFIGGTFLLLLGASAKFRAEQDPVASRKYFLQRGLKIGALALGINAATILATPATPIYFGILHCVAAAFFLLPFFLEKTKLSLLLGIGTSTLGFILAGHRFSFPWLLWLGIQPQSTAGWDYYPLLPWFGIALLGTLLSGPIERGNNGFGARFSGQALAPIRWLGQHSLLVYIVHQPLLLAFLWVLGIARF